MNEKNDTFVEPEVIEVCDGINWTFVPPKKNNPEDTFHSYISIFGAPIIVVVGLIGNILIFLAMRTKRLKCLAAVFIFQALAVSDFLNLSLCLLPRWLESLMDNHFMLGHVVCQLEALMIFFASTMSSWLITDLAVLRLLAFSWPLKFRISSYVTNLCRRIIAVQVVFGVFFHATNVFGGGFRRDLCFLGSIKLMCNNMQGVIQGSISATLCFLLPAIIIITCNVILMVKIHFRYSSFGLYKVCAVCIYECRRKSALANDEKMADGIYKGVSKGDTIPGDNSNVTELRGIVAEGSHANQYSEKNLSSAANGHTVWSKDQSPLFTDQSESESTGVDPRMEPNALQQLQESGATDLRSFRPDSGKTRTKHETGEKKLSLANSVSHQAQAFTPLQQSREAIVPKQSRGPSKQSPEYMATNPSNKSERSQTHEAPKHESGPTKQAQEPGAVKDSLGSKATQLPSEKNKDPAKRGNVKNKNRNEKYQIPEAKKSRVAATSDFEKETNTFWAAFKAQQLMYTFRNKYAETMDHSGTVHVTSSTIPITMTVFVTTMVYLTLLLPLTIILVLGYSGWLSFNSIPRNWMAAVLLMQYVNNAVHFFIYFAFWRQFRHSILELLRFKKSQGQECSNCVPSHHVHIAHRNKIVGGDPVLANKKSDLEFEEDSRTASEIEDEETEFEDSSVVDEADENTEEEGEEKEKEQRKPGKHSLRKYKKGKKSLTRSSMALPSRQRSKAPRTDISTASMISQSSFGNQ